MLTRCLPAALLAAVLLPAQAHADPVSIAVGGGTTTSLPAGPAGSSNDLMESLESGEDSMCKASSVAATNSTGGGLDVAPFHSGVSDGFTSSNTPRGLAIGRNGGLSNGQGVPRSGQTAALERSAIFAGGSVAGSTDDGTTQAVALMLTGVAGSSGALHANLRAFAGGSNSLARLSGDDAVTTSPEPASILLIGTGLAGLAAARRRRHRAVTD